MLLRLVNRYEEIVHGEIVLSANRWRLSVYPKVRVADVISLDKVRATGDLGRFGLQSHFDFVICRDKWNPVYAVEFDGRYHTTKVQQQRDRKKDELCLMANFPILRINSRYLTKAFGSMSLLAWIMDVYELQEEFYVMQARGAIPYDEPFDPFFIMGIGQESERFPYWFSAKHRIKLQQLHKVGRIAEPISSGLIGRDSNNVMRGIEFIRVTVEEGLYVRTAMRPQSFPIIFSELLNEIIFVQLASEVSRWIAGEIKAIPLHQIYDCVSGMERELTLLHSHSYGSMPK
ncbi:DUF2726 domain-containing protein [Thalassospira xiamenensis]|uniref:DUF2726 domain-containing protein n=1 Tax=Thalassospira xiamenensis TaxID=220697 RepID=A0A285RHV4_9PROT|nr:DUF2726 domain-containing protein [Thalassospira xiamenensis]SOB93715.1 Protein of unknown function [Thalassospira xiamenensis]